MHNDPRGVPARGQRPNRERPVLAAYLSGHGFGHFTRSSAVLERIADRFAIHIRTTAQGLVLARRARWPASVTKVDVGPGVTQRGPLAVDPFATLGAIEYHLLRLPGLVEEEARWLARIGARAVYADVPPLAFAAAARAGLPSMGMGNFSWSYIYDGYAHHHEGFARAAEALRREEARATAFLALEGGGGLEHFPGLRPIPPVLRRPQPLFDGAAGRARLRRRLGIGEDERRPVVLLSFGGFGSQLELRDAAAHNTELRLLIVSGPPDLALPHARSVEPGEPGEPGERGAASPSADEEPSAITHPDLVFAADCLIGKPGYGTVAECLHRPTAYAHVPRGEFREQEPLLAFLRRYLRQAPLSYEDFLAGRWRRAVEAACFRRAPRQAPKGDGVTEAAAALIAFVEGAPATTP